MCYFQWRTHASFASLMIHVQHQFWYWFTTMATHPAWNGNGALLFARDFAYEMKGNALTTSRRHRNASRQLHGFTAYFVPVLGCGADANPGIRGMSDCLEKLCICVCIDRCNVFRLFRLCRVQASSQVGTKFLLRRAVERRVASPSLLVCTRLTAIDFWLSSVCYAPSHTAHTNILYIWYYATIILVWLPMIHNMTRARHTNLYFMLPWHLCTTRLYFVVYRLCGVCLCVYVMCWQRTNRRVYAYYTLYHWTGNLV